MRGEVKEIYKIFDGVDKRIIIPVYQRNYDWALKHCNQLFDDLLQVIESGRQKHFFGAVVGYSETSFKWIVIDGQQRITTVSLLILALVHAYEAGEVFFDDLDLPEKLRDNYLLTDTRSQEAKMKLKPVKDDAEAYSRLFTETSDFIESSSVTANYRHFRERLSKMRLSGDQLWQAICSLEVMLLDLEVGHDDPQRIFESLNSTGLALKESDKIRNFVLMDRPTQEQDRLYEQFWNPMEISLDFRTDWFIRWFLVAETGRTPRESDIYEDFKAYFARNAAGAEAILTQMRNFAAYTKELQDCQTGDATIDHTLLRFNPIRGDVLLPLLLPLYRDVKDGELSSKEFVELLEILESFLFRRIVCTVPTNRLTKIFGNMYSEIVRYRAVGVEVRDALVYLLHRSDDATSKFPSDVEFLESLRTRNIYNMTPKYRTYLFDYLENGKSKDSRDIANKLRQGSLSIEHIMPQKLNNAWHDHLGEDANRIHQEWCHRLGNLTVTGYNSSYSNSSFEKKLYAPDGFKDSPYRLNQEVKASDSWGEEQMRQRTELLAQRCLELWPNYQTDFIPPSKPRDLRPMGSDATFTNETIVGFVFEGDEQRVESWKEMLLAVLRHLLSDRPGEVMRFATNKVDSQLLLQNDSDARNHQDFDHGLVVVTQSSTVAKLRLLRNLFGYLDIDTDDLIFILKGTFSTGSEAENSAESKESESPYSSLLSLLPEVEHARKRPQSVDWEKLEASLQQQITAVTPDDYERSLSGRYPQDILAADQICKESVDAVIAALARILRSKEMFSPTVLADAVKNGQISGALKRISNLQH